MEGVLEMKTSFGRVEQIAEGLGWAVTREGKTVGFWKHSPLGEDFGISLTVDELSLSEVAYEVGNYGFDPDEHAAMWIDNRHTVRGVPQSVLDLAEDALEIEKMIDQLNSELDRAAFEEKRMVA